MLKNNDIIATLTDTQKIRLLTGVGSLAGNDFKILGIRGVKALNIKDYGRNKFPHATALAHAWSEDLWKRVADVKAAKLIDAGADLAIVPGAKTKISPFRREITEDPYLASRFASVHSSRVEAAGLTSALSGYYLTEGDTAWMDEHPSNRFVNEFVTMPYLESIKSGNASAVMT